jgi:hypothetical protein
VMIGCGGGSSSDSSAASGSAPASKPAGTAGSGSAKPAAPPPVTLDDLPKSDLPAIKLELPPVKALKVSGDLNTKGLQAAGTKKLDEAADHFRKAVEADSGNLLARYNLASAIVATKPKVALAMLKEIKDAGCRICLGIAIHAKTDDDWKAVRDDPQFKLLTDGIKIDNPDPKIVADAFTKGHSGPNEGARKPTKLPAEVSALIHPRAGIKVWGGGDRPDNPRSVFEVLYQPADLERWLASGKFYLSEFDGCRDNPKEKTHCCGFKLGQAEDADYITTVCLGESPGNVWYIATINVEESI